MRINLGGTIQLSTVDWSGSEAAVIFLRGCPLRCPHCQNKDLQKGDTPAELYISHKELRVRWIGHSSVREKRRGLSGQITLEDVAEMTEEGPFLTRLVLSGGEPLMQPEAVKAISTAARIAGLKVGIETCGYYPDRLSSILKEGLMDRVFLDIKAALKEDEYARATGTKGGAIRVQESLKCLMESGVPFEVRITAFPEMPTSSEVSEIAGVLKNLKKEIPGGRLERVWIQQGQPSDGEFIPVRSEVLRELANLMGEVATVCVREKPIMRWGPGV